MTDQPTGGIQIDGAINYHSLLFISMTVGEAETTLTAELISCLRHNEALVRGAFGNNVTYSVTRDGITIGALTLLPDYIPGITTPVMWTHRTACERAIEQHGRTRDHWPADDCAQIDRFEIILDRVMSNLVALSEERRDQLGTAQAGTDPAARKRTGRPILTQAEIDHRRAIVAQAEGLKRDTPGLSWKEIAKQIGTRARTLRDWRKDQRYQPAADNAKK